MQESLVDSRGLNGGDTGQATRSPQDDAAYRLLPQRAGALVIDAGVWFLLSVIAGAAFGQTQRVAVAPDGTELINGWSATLSPLQSYAVTCFWFVYLLVAESWFGATLGKKAAGIRVLRSDGTRARFISILVRHAPCFAILTVLYLTGAVGLVPLVFVVEAGIAATGERRQRLGDRLAGTVVLRTRDLVGNEGIASAPMNLPTGQVAAVVGRTPSNLGPPDQIAGRSGPQPATMTTRTGSLPTRLMLGAAILVVSMVTGIVKFEVWVEDTPAELVVRSMTGNLQANASDAIADAGTAPDEVTFRESALDVNNAFVPGRTGWEIDGSGTRVFGTDVRIGEHQRITLGLGDEGRYSGVLVVRDGRIELEHVLPSGEHPFEEVLTAEGFEKVIEDGLNGALEAHGLKARALTIGDGVLVVDVASLVP